MSQFEFLFSLFTIVMGLSLVELLAGLGRAMEFRLGGAARGEAFSFGWLTPLLAIFVILDLLSFWMFAWTVRELVVVSALSVVAIVAFSGAYYLAARLVFPSDPERFQDLDVHYHRVQRVVFVMLIAMLAMQWAFVLMQPQLRAMAASPLSLAMTLVLLALMIAAALVRNRKASIVLLAALIARYLAIYVT